LFTELREKNRALTEAHAQVIEALEQQTATSEVLRVISSSPTAVQPVFESLVASAARLCGANDLLLLIREADVLRPAAGVGSFWESLAEEFRVPLVRGTVAARSVIDGATLHFADLATMPEAECPVGRDLQRRFGHHTVLAVPLMREGVALGTIFAMRFEVRPFAGQQVALLTTFADQAVIAIENVRLFKELEARNRDLTATAEILRVIASSPTSIQSTFEAIAKAATTLCEADLSGLYPFDGDLIHFGAQDGRTQEEIDAARQAFPQPLNRLSVTARAILAAAVVQVADVSEDPQVADPLRIFRTVLSVPMLREGRPLGAITVARRVVRAFTETQIELLKTFADQAVIAIENVRLFKELEAANLQLEAASRHKSEFLANMSHELRTPLNAVIGFSEVLLQRMFGALNDKQDEYLKDIYASGHHLLSLINDILDLSKIEAGRMELAPAPFHLPTTLENAVTLVKERAARHGITLELDLDPGLGELMGDERKVKQVLLNLLSNAVKFTPEGGRISLKAGRTDGLVQIAVTDTGIGIALEDQSAIFEEFRQVGSDETRKQEGTGLGLTLAKKFVELHGGRIWVESEPCRGSTFTFTLPVA
jgi:signal transduction histidine kinase